MGTPRLDIGMGSGSSAVSAGGNSMTDTTDSDLLLLLRSVSLTGVLCRSSTLWPGVSASIFASSIICFRFISKLANSWKQNRSSHIFFS